jgi:hypothetical protein
MTEPTQEQKDGEASLASLWLGKKAPLPGRWG